MKQTLKIPDTPYALEFDGDICWTLLETIPAHASKKKGHEGEPVPERVKPLSYHATPEAALTECIRLQAASEPLDTVQDYLNAMNAVTDRIASLAKIITVTKGNGGK